MATIVKSRKTVSVKPGVIISPTAFVLLTPRSNIGSRGLWYTTNPSKNSLTIRMSATRGAPTRVGWLLLERG